MSYRSRIARIAAATGALALIVAGGVTLAQSGGGEAGSDDQVVRDEVTIELAWIDADGTTGTETIVLDLTDAPDHAASEPSPASIDPPQDPMKS